MKTFRGQKGGLLCKLQKINLKINTKSSRSSSQIPLPHLSSFSTHPGCIFCSLSRSFPGNLKLLSHLLCRDILANHSTFKHTTAFSLRALQVTISTCFLRQFTDLLGSHLPYQEVHPSAVFSKNIQCSP